MADNSKIAWTTHTFNPWRGCSKVSEGCRNCYADATSKRNPAVMGVWGPNGTRVVASESQWKEPLKWDRWAKEGTCYRCHGGKKKLQGVCEVCDGRHQIGTYRARVFCASLADVFEDWQGFMKGSDEEPLAFPHNSWQDRRPWIPLSECGGGEVPVRMDHVRSRLLTLIHQTPNLDWLLLTKRPEGITPTLERIASRNGDGPDLAKQWLHGAVMPNIWLGTSVENQEVADQRIPELLKVPATSRSWGRSGWTSHDGADVTTAATRDEIISPITRSAPATSTGSSAAESPDLGHDHSTWIGRGRCGTSAKMREWPSS